MAPHSNGNHTQTVTEVQLHLRKLKANPPSEKKKGRRWSGIGPTKTASLEPAEWADNDDGTVFSRRGQEPAESPAASAGVSARGRHFGCVPLKPLRHERRRELPSFPTGAIGYEKCCITSGTCYKDNPSGIPICFGLVGGPQQKREAAQALDSNIST